MTRRPPARLLAALAGALGLLGAAGCGQAPSATSTVAPNAVGATAPRMPSCAGSAAVAIVGGRANSPVPELTPDLSGLLGAAFDHRGALALIDTGGRPALHTTTLGSTAQNPEAKDADRASQFAVVNRALGADTPLAAQADPWAAIALGVHWLHAQGGGTLVVEDSGLGTSGFLDYTVAGLLGADPAQLVAYAHTNQELPDARGIAILLSGLGYTAPPQAPLDEPVRADLIAQYQALLTAAGACVDIDTTPLTGPGLAQSKPVTTIDTNTTGPPKPTKTAGTCAATLDSAEVRFVVDTATLADPEGARSILEQVISDVAKGPRAPVTITGTTSSEGGPTINQPLSAARAQVIAALLVHLGVPATQIATVQGVGTNFGGFLPDTTPDGTLIPAAAAANRHVTITWPCTTSP